MIHIGRNRYKTHGGIPHGSTNGLGTKLEFYLQNNVGVAVGEWTDQSANTNDVTQATAGDQAALAEGGLDFEASEADHYDFDSQIELTAEHGFAIFLVCKFESMGAHTTILGLNNTTHFFEFMAGNDTLRIKLGSGATSTNSITPDTANLFANDEKFVMTLTRDSGATGNLIVYKNGVLLSQASAGQASNPGDGEFITLGTRSADRYLDGIVHDIAMINMGASTNVPTNTIDRINTYLTSKHGLN